MNTKAMALVGATVAVLGGLFVVFRPATGPGPDSTATPAPASPTAPPAVIEKVVELLLRDGSLESGPALIQARQHQVLRLTVRSNKPDELHLHGYDIVVPLQADEPAELRLPLTHAGRFEIELHHAHGALAVLEVEPEAR